MSTFINRLEMCQFVLTLCKTPTLASLISRQKYLIILFHLCASFTFEVQNNMTEMRCCDLNESVQLISRHLMSKFGLFHLQIFIQSNSELAKRPDIILITPSTHSTSYWPFYGGITMDS